MNKEREDLLLRAINDMRELVEYADECRDLRMSDLRKIDSSIWEIAKEFGFGVVGSRSQNGALYAGDTFVRKSDPRSLRSMRDLDLSNPRSLQSMRDLDQKEESE